MSLNAILSAGYRPYVSTASFLANSLNLKPFGIDIDVYGTTQAADAFHQTYLATNALAFGADIGMPNWVLTDCVLYQTAVVGFTASKELCPTAYVDELRRRGANVDSLDHIPVTGQIAGLTVDRETWFGFSLISHQFPKGGLSYQFEDGLPSDLRLASYTKALALEVYRSQRFMGLTQYDNKAVVHHGLFGRMFLREPIVWRHERAHDSFIYEMDVDFDINDLKARSREQRDYTFLLDSDDRQMKTDFVNRIAAGERFEIVPPFRIVSGDKVELPILVHN